jgi:hypothetical protein
MIIQENKDTAVSNMTGEANSFTIKQTAFMAELLSRKLYSNPTLAVIRELISNAIDVSGCNVDIQAPSFLEPTFIVRDYGTGLSREDVMTLYTTYGESTKRDTNSVIGGFGVGSKSPFALTDTFTVTSRYKGERTDYVCYKDKGFPRIREVCSAHTDEPDGLEVRVPIEDMSRFNEELDRYVWYAQKLGYPLRHEVKDEPTVLYEDDKVLITMDSKSCGGTFMSMGPNLYAMSVDRTRYACVIVFKGRIGNCPVSASRESLEVGEEETSLRMDLEHHLGELAKHKLVSVRKVIDDTTIIPVRLPRTYGRYSLSVSSAYLCIYNDTHKPIDSKFIKWLSTKTHKEYYTGRKSLSQPKSNLYYSELLRQYGQAYATYKKRNKKQTLTMMLHRSSGRREIVKVAELEAQDVGSMSLLRKGVCFYGASDRQLVTLRRVRPEAILSESEAKKKVLESLKDSRRRIKGEQTKMSSELKALLGVKGDWFWLSYTTNSVIEKYYQIYGNPHEKLKDLNRYIDNTLEMSLDWRYNDIKKLNSLPRYVETLKKLKGLADDIRITESDPV